MSCTVVGFQGFRPFRAVYYQKRARSAEFSGVFYNRPVRPCQIASKLGKTRARIAEHKSQRHLGRPFWLSISSLSDLRACPSRRRFLLIIALPIGSPHNLPNSRSWSAHASKSGPSRSPFPLNDIATAAGELFLFGGYLSQFASSDVYVFSTRDFSTTLLQTSGEVPTPRYAHRTAHIGTGKILFNGAGDNR